MYQIEFIYDQTRVIKEGFGGKYQNASLRKRGK